MIPASTWIESASPFSISTRQVEQASRHLRPEYSTSCGCHPSVEAASHSSGFAASACRSALRLSISPLEQTSAARMDLGGDDDRRGPLDVPNAGGGDPSWTRFRRSRRAGRATRRGPERIHGTADVRYADVVGREMAVGQTRSPTATIVGVAADTDVGNVFADPRPLAYVPLTQHYQPLPSQSSRRHPDR